MCAFICSIDDSVWTSVEEEWETPYRDGAILWLWGAVAPPKIWEKNY